MHMFILDKLHTSALQFSKGLVIRLPGIMNVSDLRGPATMEGGGKARKLS